MIDKYHNFGARGSHTILYCVELPRCLPKILIERMIAEYTNILYHELDRFMTKYNNGELSAVPKLHCTASVVSTGSTSSLYFAPVDGEEHGLSNILGSTPDKPTAAESTSTESNHTELTTQPPAKSNKKKKFKMPFKIFQAERS